MYDLDLSAAAVSVTFARVPVTYTDPDGTVEVLQVSASGGVLVIQEGADPTPPAGVEVPLSLIGDFAALCDQAVAPDASGVVETGLALSALISVSLTRTGAGWTLSDGVRSLPGFVPEAGAFVASEILALLA